MDYQLTEFRKVVSRWARLNPKARREYYARKRATKARLALRAA